MPITYEIMQILAKTMTGVILKRENNLIFQMQAENFARF